MNRTFSPASAVRINMPKKSRNKSLLRITGLARPLAVALAALLLKPQALAQCCGGDHQSHGSMFVGDLPKRPGPARFRVIWDSADAATLKVGASTVSIPSSSSAALRTFYLPLRGAKGERPPHRGEIVEWHLLNAAGTAAYSGTGTAKVFSLNMKQKFRTLSYAGSSSGYGYVYEEKHGLVFNAASALSAPVQTRISSAELPDPDGRSALGAEDGGEDPTTDASESEVCSSSNHEAGDPERDDEGSQNPGNGDPETPDPEPGSAPSDNPGSSPPPQGGGGSSLPPAIAPSSPLPGLLQMDFAAGSSPVALSNSQRLGSAASNGIGAGLYKQGSTTKIAECTLEFALSLGMAPDPSGNIAYLDYVPSIGGTPKSPKDPTAYRLSRRSTHLKAYDASGTPIIPVPKYLTSSIRRLKGPGGITEVHVFSTYIEFRQYRLNQCDSSEPYAPLTGQISTPARTTKIEVLTSGAPSDYDSTGCQITYSRNPSPQTITETYWFKSPSTTLPSGTHKLLRIKQVAGDATSERLESFCTYTAGTGGGRDSRLLTTRHTISRGGADVLVKHIQNRYELFSWGEALVEYKVLKTGSSIISPGTGSQTEFYSLYEWWDPKTSGGDPDYQDANFASLKVRRDYFSIDGSSFGIGSWQAFFRDSTVSPEKYYELSPFKSSSAPSSGANVSSLKSHASGCVSTEFTFSPVDQPSPSTTTYEIIQRHANTIVRRNVMDTVESTATSTIKQYIDGSNFMAKVISRETSGKKKGFIKEIINLKKNQTTPVFHYSIPANNNWSSRTVYFYYSDTVTSSTVMNDELEWENWDPTHPVRIIGSQTLYPGELNPVATFRFINSETGREMGSVLSVGDFDYSGIYEPVRKSWTTYDIFGRPTSKTSSTDGSKYWSYSGLSVTVTHSGFGSVKTTYDGFGRIIESRRMESPEISSYSFFIPGHNAILTTYEYAARWDSGGNLAGSLVTATMTARNSSNAIMSTSGVQWSRVAVIERDGLGQVSAYLDHLNNVKLTTYKLSPSGFSNQLVAETRYEGGELVDVRAYFYDGRLASHTGPAVLGKTYDYLIPAAYSTAVRERKALFAPSTGAPAGALAYADVISDGLGHLINRLYPASDDGVNLVYRNVYFYYDDFGHLLSSTLPQPETSSDYHHQLSVLMLNGDGSTTTTYGSVTKSGVGAPSTTPAANVRRVKTSIVQIGSEWWRQQIEEIKIGAGVNDWSVKNKTLSLIGPFPAEDTVYYDVNGDWLTRKITSVVRQYSGSDPLPSEERVGSIQMYESDGMGSVYMDRSDTYKDGNFRNATASFNGVMVMAFNGNYSYEFPLGRAVYSPLLEPLSEFNTESSSTAWTKFECAPGTGLMTSRSKDGSGALDHFEHYSAADIGLPSMSYVGRIKTVKNNTYNPSLGAAKPTTYYRYNTRGQITEICGTGADPVQYEYENYLGRLTYMRTYAGASPSVFASGWPASPPSATSTTQWEYVLASPVLKAKKYLSTPTGNISYTYYGNGTLKERFWTRLYSSNPLKTTYTYDPYHRLSGISYADGTPSVGFTYNEAGRVKTRSDGGTARVTTYDYRVDGQVESETIASTSGTRYAGTVNPGYNTKGERTTLDVTLGGKSAPQVSYGYSSSLGRLSSVSSDNRSVESYTYSIYNGQWSGRLFKHNGINVFRDARTFQSSGRVSSITHTGYAPSGSPTSATLQTFNYYYDYERLYATKREEGKWYYQYDPTSQVEGANKQQGNPSNGVSSPPALSSAIPGTGAAYDFDLLGNRTSISEFGGGGATTVPVTYSRNAQNQYSTVAAGQSVTVYGKRATSTTEIKLNGTTLSGSDFVPSGTGLYFWKNISHSTTGLYEQITVTSQEKSPLGPVITVEDGQEYVPPSSTSPTYDLDGNLLTDGRWTYTWDGENRLKTMECAKGTNSSAQAPGWKLTFTYDGLSRRIEKKVEKMPYGSSTWSIANWETYIYDGWNMVMTLRVNSDGSVRDRVASYVWGPDLGSLPYAETNWQQAGGVGGLLMVIDGTNTNKNYPPSGSDPTDDYYFPLHDRLGNITGYRKAVSNTPAAQLDAVFEYDAFGRELFASGPAVEKLPFRFSSKFTDAETGLNYYGYRYYDPRWGRWPSRDPIGERGGVNLYGMVMNALIAKLDVLGLGTQLPPLNGRVCNKCPHPVNILIEGRYYLLPAGECSDPKKCPNITRKGMEIPYYDVDGVWVNGTFHAVGNVRTFDACVHSKPSSPDQRGRPPGDNQDPGDIVGPPVPYDMAPPDYYYSPNDYYDPF